MRLAFRKVREAARGGLRAMLLPTGEGSGRDLLMPLRDVLHEWVRRTGDGIEGTGKSTLKR